MENNNKTNESKRNEVNDFNESNPQQSHPLQIMYKYDILKDITREDLTNSDNIAKNIKASNTSEVKSNCVPLKIEKFDYGIIGEELVLIGDSLLDKKGLVSHHNESANNLYQNGLPQIITQNFKVEKEIVNQRAQTDEDKDISWIHVEVTFSNVVIKPPTAIQHSTGKSYVLYPRMALAQEKVYSGSLVVNCHMKATAHLRNGATLERTDTLSDFRISKIPIIKGSILCNTYGKPAEMLAQLGEDPTDPGGYFLVQGNEYVAECTENIIMNQSKIYLNKGYGNSLVRCEFISKPGDTYQNSSFMLVTYYNNDNITIELARNEFIGVGIPFYLFFRMLGWTDDKQLFDNIVYDYDNPSNKDIINILKRAMDAKYTNYSNAKRPYDQTQVLKTIIDGLPQGPYEKYDLKSKPQNYQQVIPDILNHLDIYCLPHIGTKASSRGDKLKFIALLIRKTLQCFLKQIPQTDRDSYRNKRVYAAGENYAKAIKTYFNQTVVMPIRRRITKDFTNASFSSVNLVNMVRTAIFIEEFEKLIVKTINMGNRAAMQLKKKNLTNHLAAQPVGRKNQINALATLRQVSATYAADSAKQSERAAEMRRVHMSFLGYICCVHSPPEGERVGINKQLAIFATIAPTLSSEVLKSVIKQDDDLIALKTLTPLYIAKNNLAKVYVNGDWIGCVKESCQFVAKYRKLRRQLIIHPHTTIYWDNTQDEVLFWVDVGRITRPLMIVYNNYRDADNVQLRKTGSSDIKTNSKKTKKSKTSSHKGGANEEKSDAKDENEGESPESDTYDPNFYQGIGITQADIDDLYTKRKTIDDLVREQKVEFITPEEQENCWVCPNFDILKDNMHNVCKQYTHCDIPEALFAITTLTSPLANHNQATRLTYQTSQVKQTCGCYALNWPHRMDKETFLQYINEMPLVRTLANKYLFASGSNIMIAIICAAWNQEDSLVINKAAVDRGMFNGCKMTFYKAELEQKEDIGNLDASKTADLKSANYGKLVDGVVTKGTLIQTDDVLIGKFMPLQKNKIEKFTHTDRSIVYRESEDAVVHECIRDFNEDDEQFCKVALRKVRAVDVGDKFCVRLNAEVLTDSGFVKLQDIDITKHKIATMDEKHQLSYVYASAKPIFDYDSDVDGKMYHIKTQFIETFTTPNHRLYVKPHKKSRKGDYKLIEARDVYGRSMHFKRNCNNIFADAEDITLKDDKGDEYKYNAEYFLKLLGMFISDGHTKEANTIFGITKQRKKDYLDKCAAYLGFEWCKGQKERCEHQRFSIGRKTIPGIYELFRELSVGAHNKRLPELVWTLGQKNCLHLLDGLINGDGNTKTKGETQVYYTSSEKLADDVQRLALHCGWSANIKVKGEIGEENIIEIENKENKHFKRRATLYRIGINRLKNEPQINHDRVKFQNGQKEQWVDYKGQVGCLEIPDTHLFYYREDKLAFPHWTGNSNRHGQKGVVALLMREEDMPFTKGGIRPVILFNSHGMPTRMTCAQYFEMMIGNICAKKGTTVDCTIFKKSDIESIADELEKLGMNRYGYERLMHGITGEYIDSLIFFGPLYYQRLQKFIADAEYSVRNAATDAVTLQAADSGRSGGGGLKIGEMEKDVICSHGAMAVLNEKFYGHSDGYVEYVCRCGKAAVVNHAEKLYKCAYCKDNADIVAVPTSWSSKLFRQEVMSCNVGLRIIPKPFTYEVFKDVKTPEIYNRAVIKQLGIMVEDGKETEETDEKIDVFADQAKKIDELMQ